jgi:molybdopterin-guanine dinucleotide biosynthesis protein A
VVLAGGGVEPGLPPDLPTKALLPVGGRPLLAHVLQALGQSPGVGRIAVVGPAAVQPWLPPGARYVPEEGSLMANVAAALRALGSEAPVLVVASDIPLLTPEAVEEFLAACRADPADFHYAIVPQDAMERAFPGARKTYVTVADGTFTGGSIMLVRPQVVDRVRPLVERLIASRKKPWLLAQAFGWSVVLKFASGRLSIAEMMDRVAEMAGIAARAVILPRPEVALDVDAGKPHHLALIARALEREG